MKNYKKLIESGKTPKEILEEASKIAVSYSSKTFSKKSGGDSKLSNSYKDTWTSENIEDMLKHWDMYKRAGNLPKYLLTAYMFKFNLKNFKDKPIKELLKKALSKSLKIDIVTTEFYSFGSGIPSRTEVSFKVNGKEISK